MDPRVSPIVEAAVHELVRRYFVALDRRDFDVLGRCFAEDAAGRYRDGEWLLNGRAEIVDGCRLVSAFVSSIHAVAWIDLRSAANGMVAGEVSAVAYLADERGEPRLLTRGLRYEDVYCEYQGEWVIKSRLHRPLWQTAQPLTPSLRT